MKRGRESVKKLGKSWIERANKRERERKIVNEREQGEREKKRRKKTNIDEAEGSQKLESTICQSESRDEVARTNSR